MTTIDGITVDISQARHVSFIAQTDSEPQEYRIDIYLRDGGQRTIIETDDARAFLRAQAAVLRAFEGLAQFAGQPVEGGVSVARFADCGFDLIVDPAYGREILEVNGAMTATG